MVDSFFTMKKHLNDTGVYDIENPSLINELKAYAFVINELNQGINTMLSECFISSAQSYGLEFKERLIGNIREELSTQDRRKMLSLRETIDSNSFTVERIKQAIESFCLRKCILSEYPMLCMTGIEISGNFTQAQKDWIKEQIRKIMPAHLSLSISFNGYTWAYNDLKNNRFSYIDNLDYTWETIDNLL